MKNLTIEEIQERTCHHFNISMSKLLGQTRKQDVVEARQVGMFLSKKYTDQSLKIIGLKFGGRDHSTVIHALRTVERRKELNTEFKKSVEQLNNRLSKAKRNEKIQELEQKAKRQPTKIPGLFETDLIRWPESIYCFTESELFEYKQALRNEENY